MSRSGAYRCPSIRQRARKPSGSAFTTARRDDRVVQVFWNSLTGREEHQLDLSARLQQMPAQLGGFRDDRHPSRRRRGTTVESSWRSFAPGPSSPRTSAAPSGASRMRYRSRPGPWTCRRHTPEDVEASALPAAGSASRRLRTSRARCFDRGFQKGPTDWPEDHDGPAKLQSHLEAEQPVFDAVEVVEEPAGGGNDQIRGLVMPDDPPLFLVGQRS